jgi:hypothetical protein
MRTVIGWIVVVAAVLLIGALVASARGPAHHHGDDVGAVSARPTLGSSA